MELLKDRDRRRLNECISAVRRIRKPEQLKGVLRHVLTSLIHSDVTAVECFDGAAQWSGRLFADPLFEVERHFPAFLREMASHPFYPAFVSNRLWHPLRISDVSSQSALRNSAIYSDFFRPLGVDRQMAVAIPSPNNTAGVLVFSRKGREFGDLEVTLLSAMIPHIAKAEKRAGAFPGSPSRSVRLLPSADADSAQFCYTLIDTLNITLRQGEILWWLSHGKTDQDIAGLCSISKRTVQKHLENMYARLGVENRTAAVLRALESYRRFQA